MLRSQPARVRLLACLLLVAAAAGVACQCARPDPTVLYRCNEDSDCAGLEGPRTCFQKVCTPIDAVDAGCTPRTCGELECGARDDGCGGQLLCACDVDAGFGCGAGGVPGQCAQCTVPDAGDEPDDQFLDTNCDGIDGNGAESIFVARNGSGTNGTRDAPVGTLRDALKLVQGSRRHILIAGVLDYAEDLEIKNVSASLHGGYVRGGAGWLDWQRRDDVVTVRALNYPGHAVRDAGECLMDRLRLRAQSGFAASPDSDGASVGLTVENANLVLRHVSIEADVGRSGEAGAPGDGGNPGLSGADAWWTATGEGIPGDGGTPGCSGGLSGGAGGDPRSLDGGSGASGQDGGAGGTPGDNGVCECFDAGCFLATDGAPGEPGPPGMDGAPGVRLVDPPPLGALYVPQAGLPGQPGGGGGGGGAGGTYYYRCTP
ncbi:MAG TPA: hypothetical protein VE782_05770, partial [Myxococcaceae bacterium]|nr:hypothetical protein [Myxococcaceae bacterium]